MTAQALLVGAGGMGRVWARNLAARPDVSIAGWVDLKPGAAAAAAQEIEVDVAWTGEELEQGIREARPDFVVDVSVPEAHHDVTLRALAAGLPVLGEKPMADTMDRARAMVAAAERAGTLYMVSQNRRFDARIRAFRDLIARAVGSLGILNSDFYIGAHFGGFRDAMPSPLLLDMAIHTFDAARYLSGADAVAVYCEEWNPPWSWYNGAACATAVFEMSGGLRYTYRGSWCSEGRHTSWEAEWRGVGPRGSATWDGNTAPVAEVITEQGGFHARFATRTAEMEDDLPSGIAGSLDEFLRALRTGSTPQGECHDNIKSLAMVHAAIESSRSGRRVRLDEIF